MEFRQLALTSRERHQRRVLIWPVAVPVYQLTPRISVSPIYQHPRPPPLVLVAASLSFPRPWGSYTSRPFPSRQTSPHFQPICETIYCSTLELQLGRRKPSDFQPLTVFVAPWQVSWLPGTMGGNANRDSNWSCRLDEAHLASTRAAPSVGCFSHPVERGVGGCWHWRWK